MAVGAIEADAGAGEGVDVRRQRLAAVRAHARAAIVGDEQQDVLTGLGREGGEAGEESEGDGEAHEAI